MNMAQLVVSDICIQPLIRIESLIAPADYFDVSADYLFGLSDEPTAHRKEEPNGQ